MSVDDSRDCVVFPPTPDSVAWARAALEAARSVLIDPDAQAQNLRHGQTWFVGVDALPSAPDGQINGVPLRGPWQAYVPQGLALHRAQLSVMYQGYPRRDPDQSESNHRYRVNRAAAHVDGLLPVGPQRRRYAREFHAYVLGIVLNDCQQAPTVYWEGSHTIMGAALRAAIGMCDPRKVDVTETYQDARREVFERCEKRAVTGSVGSSFLLHRFTLHGTEPWTGPAHPEGRMIAFFRPEFSARHWLSGQRVSPDGGPR